MTQPDRSPILRLVPIALILAVAGVGAFLLGDTLSFETLRDNRLALIEFRDAHYLWMAVIFVAAYTGIVAFSLPGAVPASLAGGFLFGLFPGVFFNMGAATVGAIAIFLAAKVGFGDRLAARMEASEGMVKRLKDGFDDNQWSMLFLIRLVPIVPFFVANLIPAMVGVSLQRFAISTVIGIIPGALVYTSIGAGLGEVFEAGETLDLSILFAPHVIGPMLGLAALAALPMVIKAIRGKGGVV